MTKSHIAIVLAAVLSIGAATEEHPLVDAVRHGDRARVTDLLQQGADATSADAYGQTALHWAVELDDLETVELLLDAGADPTAVNRYGVAPLSLACTNGNDAIVGRLLTRGADPDTTGTGGETVLMTAARTGNEAVVTDLLARGADVNRREDARGQTALMWAAAEGHTAVIRALVAAGGDLGARSGRPATEPAAPVDGTRRTRPATVPMPDYFIRSNGGVLNAPMLVDSMTPLMFAVRDGRVDAVRTLVELGASVDETASNGLSVLVLAVINAHYELAAFLLDRGADPNAAGQGWTALHQVVATPRFSYGRFPHPARTGRVTPLELAEALIERGADVNARMSVPTMGDGYRTRLNRLDATPLLLAAKGAYPEMMRLLLDRGADLRATTAEGTTALMLAAGVSILNEGDDAGTEAETLEAVTLLVEQGANINQTDDNGETAVHGAAYRGHNSVVQYLADHGADLNVENRIGWTPLTIADGVLYAEFFKQHRDTAALLRRLLQERGVAVEDEGIVNVDIDPRANRSGAHPSAAQSAAPTVDGPRLYVFDCGTLIRGEPTAYNLTREQVGSTDFADPCYLVAHPRGTLLWDVGIIPDDQITPGGVEVQAANGTNVARTTLRSQLAAIGYRPRDITFLAMSHGHADHVANANDYASATLLIQGAEWDSMFGAAAEGQPVFATYSALRNAETIRLDGDHDVFGDGTVVLKSTPGHTPGHQSLFVELANTGPLLLTGDLYHYAAERTFGTIPVRDDQARTGASRAAMEALLRETGAQLWIQHDILAYPTLKHAPEFYD